MTGSAIFVLKDGLRRFRYSARREADAADRMLASAGALLSSQNSSRIEDKGPLRALVDKAIVDAEGLLRRILARPSRRADAVSDYLLPIGTLLTRNPVDRRSPGFARSYDRAVSIVLRRLGVRNAYVSEHAIIAAEKTLCERYADLIARVARRAEIPAVALSEVERADVIMLCAAVVHELAAVHPIRQVQGPGSDDQRAPRLFLSPNAYCFCILGIANAIVSLHQPALTLDFDEVVASANLVVDARFKRFHAALLSRDPVPALAKEFATVIPFLP